MPPKGHSTDNAVANQGRKSTEVVGPQSRDDLEIIEEARSPNEALLKNLPVQAPLLEGAATEESHTPPEKDAKNIDVSHLVWLRQTNGAAFPKLLEQAKGSPDFTRKILSAVKTATLRELDVLNNTPKPHLSWTTLYKEGRSADTIRQRIKDMDATIAGDDGSEQVTFNVLDVTRDALINLKEEIAAYAGGAEENEQFLINKLDSSIENVLDAIGRTAYDRPARDRVLTSGVAIISSAALVAVPMLFIYYSVPAAWYFLASFIAPTARTLVQLYSYGMNGGTSGTQYWNLTHERLLTWAMPSILFAKPVFDAARASDNPDDPGLRAAAEKSHKDTAEVAFTIAMGALQFGILFLSNESLRNSTTGMAKRVLGVGQQAQDLQIELARRDGENGSQTVTDAYELANDLVRILQDFGADLNKGGHSPNSENAIFAELDRMVGQMRQVAEKALVDLPVSAAVAPPSKDTSSKKSAFATYTALNLLLGGISVASVSKTPALVPDYVAYYGFVEWLLTQQTFFNEASPATELDRLFGSYLGGTVLGTPIALANLLSIFLSPSRIGLFDVAQEDGYTSKNAMDPMIKRPAPSRLEPNDSWHYGNGLGQFIGATAFNLVTTLMMSGEIGRWIADFASSRAKNAATTDVEAAYVDDIYREAAKLARQRQTADQAGIASIEEVPDKLKTA
ncbi:hypothetical protein ACK9YZ_31435 [Rhizobium sp. ZK1]|uniref:hypothetical protein n=1 Tax=Rhizobium sp. ZK1 TaxID=3389872 RepID=UPI0039F69606